MKNLKFTYLFFMLIAADAFSEEAQFYAMGKTVLGEMVAIESTETEGMATKVSEYAESVLIGNGFASNDLEVAGPTDQSKGLYAIYRGESSKEPVVVMAHVDVVPAVKGSWTTDPFKMTEIEGFLHGRGTSDNKGGAAGLVATFVKLRSEGFIPKNDIIMLLTGDEETGMQSIRYFRDNYKNVQNASFALNSDGGYLTGTMKNPESFRLQSAEKVYFSVTLTTKNKGGHSSIPRRDNAIYDLADAIKKIQEHDFPVSLNETTYGTLEFAMKSASDSDKSQIQSILNGEEKKYEILETNRGMNAILRTTCVATKLNGGHAENALPVSATATVNCRLVPQADSDEVLSKIKELVGNNVEVMPITDVRKSPPSPITAEIQELIASSIHTVFPNLPVVPTMSTGATDAIALRSSGISVYGTSAMMSDPTGYRGHGLDERIEISAFNASLDFWYALMKQL
ncbi:MAG: M20/M25/M40 family metallo-hydrolase [Gammaproteobacteria bacterium]|jgi:acetylornithine deacetylase/succinyl-diaminopimelate desuccinylase-like protein|nr:hypothetical protein [Gammaproteobacteria bacterium]MBQ09717.1 hypothetical protein [Gammaproteobacteria bacterium]MDP6147070.1 M20/M25/M40 family metallo-hydrolase [Gammaproteobacteria bacterium]HJL79576.1 M20/M25/M40 family metallo-hydrolase [Gammaproteobacteria bacterium]HJM09717.1 M20/M25/M40 family metallo-hydrolase [Gammaproteobacteria bacterium]|tara:strand:- start:8077 stop:9441 length:1365 start_codon:yes stop_codon:yes gene_type:complete